MSWFFNEDTRLSFELIELSLGKFCESLLLLRALLRAVNFCYAFLYLEVLYEFLGIGSYGVLVYIDNATEKPIYYIIVLRSILALDYHSAYN